MRHEPRDEPREPFKPSRTETIRAADPKAGMDLDELRRAVEGDLRARVMSLERVLRHVGDMTGQDAVIDEIAQVLNDDTLEGPVDGRTPRVKARLTMGGRIKLLTIERP